MRRLIGFASLLLVACIVIASQREFTNEESFQTSTEPALIRRASQEEATHLVSVRSKGRCSGVPLKGTLYVVTAAHCVLDDYTGKFTSKYDIRVEYNDTRYDVSAVLVQETSAPSKGKVASATDMAVLVLTKSIPGIGVDLGSYKDIHNGGTLIGYQPLAGKDTFYHPSTHSELTTSGVVAKAAPAACTFTGDQVKTLKNFWSIPCGMIPGGSGGPVLVLKNGKLLLVGVLSSVNDSLSYNGITPVSIAAELLHDPDRYYHSLAIGGLTSIVTSGSAR